MSNKLWQARAAAWRDGKLSAPAARLFLLLTDLHWRAFAKGEEFPFSATTAAGMLGNSCWRAGRRYIKELVLQGLLIFRGLKGCPATCHYIFGPSSCDRKGITSCDRKGITSCDRKGMTGCDLKGMHHISSTLRVLMKPHGKKLAAAPELIGSLRSKETKGKKSAASPAGDDGSASPRKMPLKKRLQLAIPMKKLRQKLGKELGKELKEKVD